MRVLLITLLLFYGLAQAQAQAQAQELRDDVLIIANSNAQGSFELAQYYASKRSISEQNIIRVKTPVSFMIGWEEFEILRDQIIKFMAEKTLNGVSPSLCSTPRPYYCENLIQQVKSYTKIKYIVMMKGIATRVIVDQSPYQTISTTFPSSVDNYIKYHLVNYLTQDDFFNELVELNRDDSFYGGMNLRTVLPLIDNEIIIGRLDGPTYDSVVSQIDRTLLAEQDGIYGKLYGSNDANLEWRNTETNQMIRDWTYQFPLFGESRPECIEYLNQSVSSTEGKSPQYCLSRLMGHNELYPAHSNSRAPIADDALIYLGNLDGQPTSGNFNNFRNWRKNSSCSKAETLCKNMSDISACKQSSLDYLQEINTDCMGVNNGFIGYNHQSFPLSYFSNWPTSWYHSNNISQDKWGHMGGGDFANLALPTVRSSDGSDDNYSLWYDTESDLVANPECFVDTTLETTGTQGCREKHKVLLTQKRNVNAVDLSNGINLSISLKKKSRSINDPVTLTVRFLMKRVDNGNQLDLGKYSLTTVAAGNHYSWTTVSKSIDLISDESTCPSPCEVNGFKIILESNKTFSGELGIDEMTIRSTSLNNNTNLILNSSFNQGHEQTAAGDHAINFIHRAGGVAFWGSLSHHYSQGFSFSHTHFASVLYFLKGLALGDAVWLGDSSNSGILYGDPLYSPIAVRIKPFNKTNNITSSTPSVEVKGSVLNGLDSSHISSSYQLDLCASSDIAVCNSGNSWSSTGLAGSGGFRDQILGDLNTSNLSDGHYTLRLKLTSYNAKLAREQSFYDYYSFEISPNTDIDNDGLVDGVWDRDIDNDGIEDSDEFIFGTNPFIAESHLDLDVDGFSNYQEIMRGSNPLDYNDRPIVRTIYVNLESPESSEDGTAQAPYKSLNKARINSKAGDTIFLQDGDFTNQNFTLYASWDGITIDGNNKALKKLVFFGQKTKPVRNITIKNLTIQQLEANDISVVSFENVTFKHASSNPPLFPFLLSRSDKVSFIGVDFESANLSSGGHGLYLKESNVLFTNTNFSSGGVPVSLYINSKAQFLNSNVTGVGLSVFNDELSSYESWNSSFSPSMDIDNNDLTNESFLFMDIGHASIFHDATSIRLRKSIINPVVIAGPPSMNGGQAGVVQVKNVSSSKFDLRFDEWDYLDGNHARERVSYMVAPEGRFVTEDGLDVEVGKFNLTGTKSYSRISFTKSFKSKPLVFVTLQSDNDTDVTGVFIKNVNNSSFDAALIEQESKNNGHQSETVGYIAVDSNSLNESRLWIKGQELKIHFQSLNLNHNKIEFSPGREIFLQEEQSADTELDHTHEDVALMLLGDEVFAQAQTVNGADTFALRVKNAQAILNLGSVDVNHLKREISFSPQMIDPVVFTSVATNYGGQEGLVRTSNVKSSVFELEFQEWDYLDINHQYEEVSYLALEKGVHTMSDGSVWEMGSFDIEGNKSYIQQNFIHQESNVAPVCLLLNVQTMNETTPVVARGRLLSAKSFEAALDEEEALRGGGHALEKVAYLAIFSDSATGIVDINGNQFEYNCVKSGLSDEGNTLFENRFWVEEEKSLNDEKSHGTETISFLKIKKIGVSGSEAVFGSDVTSYGPDTISLRQEHKNYPISISASLSAAPTLIRLGEIMTLPVLQENFKGSEAIDISEKLVWESSDPLVGWVTSSGQIIGLSPGMTVIRGHYQGYHLEHVIQVR